ncbi:hypothetical protein HG536_0H03850 [Torulaspora globosa]|uniref:Meiotically up-regulated protein Msb1/Mug8 domain-containing protein n=1 Tax=Torulaspora globosa TaxID=48254 RepID=A0A7G3ZNC3_9SACH|nr:uncharacterized protein HG536_0H03850 [Torulaspora globosa]QLL35009.1 hypothetical protein HG536_0H03850 [Torulaspora globosa]
MGITNATASKPLPTPPPEANLNKEPSSSSPKRNDNAEPARPSMNLRKGHGDEDYQEDEEFEFFQSFDREKVKDVIHAITAGLKDKGADVEYLMIPFRPQQTNEKLLRLLNSLFPMGNGQPVAEKQRIRIVQKTEPLTLFQGLTYLWCRLPDGEVIGWKAYLQFKAREKEKNYPTRGFLELMPQCLSSPSHASIVYDFFDLIVSLASNSRVNKMSARKISKMCAIWAFGKPLEATGNSLDYDFTNTSESPNNSFQDGLNDWIPATDAMFHLLLAFLKSFVPQDLESAQLPSTLKSLLFNNEYPPKGSTAYSSQTVLTIPLVTLHTDRFSRKPWELLERCGELLDFSKYDAFQAREDYALLKSLFKKSNQVEGISRKMSQESRRLMKLMSTKHSTFQAGWSKRKCLPNEAKLPESIEVKRVDIDDFFIWAWLSTLSYEQTSSKRNLFGRSLILEFEFDGFKKWVLFQECDITLESRKHQRQRDIEGLVPHSELPKEQLPQKDQRKVTPVYESFQKRVPSAGSQSSDSPSSDGYHTIISKESLGKNGSKHNVNLHAIEQKIAKWNPLSKAKRKTSGNDTLPSKEERTAAPQVKKDSILIDPHRSIYELPPIERDVDGFKDIFADHGFDDDEDAELESRRTNMTRERSAPVASMTQTKNRSDEAMEELKGMMDQMITEDMANFSGCDDLPSTAGNSTRETFDSLTKFDQYKPAQAYTDTPTSSASAVPSLKLNGSVPSLQPLDSQEDVQVRADSRHPSPLEKQLPEIRINNGSGATSPIRPDVAVQGQVLPTTPASLPGQNDAIGSVARSPPPPASQEAGAPPAVRNVPRAQSPPRPRAPEYPQTAAYTARSQSPPRAPLPPPAAQPPVYPQADSYYTRSQSPARQPAPRPQLPQTAEYTARSQAAGPLGYPQTSDYTARSQSPPRQPAAAAPPSKLPANIYPPRAQITQYPGSGYPPYTRPQDQFPAQPPVAYGHRSPELRGGPYQAPAETPYAVDHPPRAHHYQLPPPNGDYARYQQPPHPRQHQYPTGPTRSPQTQARTQFYGHVDPSTTSRIPGAKLHGGHINRQQDRKKLHNNIRNGDFGI